MKLEWRDYPGDRLIADHPAGFKVIRPKENIDANRPLFCPVCEGIFLSYYDDEAWEKFQCCDACAGRWAYPQSEKWKSGWRPTPDDLQHKNPSSPI